jgi:DNA-binding CsgD family transcriptional regulator
MKSVEFKQAALTVTSALVVAKTSIDAESPVNPTAFRKPAVVTRPVANASPRNGLDIGAQPRAQPATSPVAAAAAKVSPAVPRFTAEETILLRGLSSGASSKEMALQMRLPRESLYRLIGDLRRKTGATTDAALAVWVLRNMAQGGSERRGGGR